MTPDELSNRFDYHRPTAELATKHQQVRNELAATAAFLERLVPPGRESSLVITKLEEAMFWANAAIARQGQ